HPGVAVVLLQEPAARALRLPGARPVHPADEAEEHAALADGRGPDHSPGPGVLRRRFEHRHGSVIQFTAPTFRHVTLIQAQPRTTAAEKPRITVVPMAPPCWEPAAMPRKASR